MVLKLVAFGVFEYFDDGFNVFDSLIVCLGYVSIFSGKIMLYNVRGFELFYGNLYGGSEGGLGLSVLRTFRLLRIIKLVR